MDHLKSDAHDLEFYRQSAQQRALALDEAHRQHAWQVARRAAALLKDEFGAARVSAFGALAQSGLFHPRSDIDLAVWGLDERLYFRAVGVLQSLDIDFAVNLVIFDEAKPAIQEAILSEGVDL